MAYGERRVQKASDTFDASIGASWEQGAGVFCTCAWASGGYVNPSVVTTWSSIIRVSSEVYSPNQYSKVVVQACLGSSSVAATVRQASGHAACYLGYTGDGEQGLSYCDDAAAFTFLAGNQSIANLVAGNSITIEVEGMALRFGTEEGAGDGERYNTSDNTLTSGNPGALFYARVNSIGDSQITSWLGGEISSSNRETFRRGIARGVARGV